jgi:hypothetical protein
VGCRGLSGDDESVECSNGAVVCQQSRFNLVMLIDEIAKFVAREGVGSTSAGVHGLSFPWRGLWRGPQARDGWTGP